MQLVGALWPLIEAGPDQGLFLRQPRRARPSRSKQRVGRATAARCSNRFEDCVAQEVVPAIRTDCRDGRRRGDRHRRLARRLHGGGGDLPLPVAVPRRGRHERQLRPRAAVRVRRHRATTTSPRRCSFLPNLGEGALLDTLRRRFVLLAYGGGPLGEPGRSWRWPACSAPRACRTASIPGGRSTTTTGRPGGAMLPLYLDDLADALSLRRRRRMNVIFLEPGFPANQREFVRALHSIGAHVHRHRRPALRLARRRAEGLARRLPADRARSPTRARSNGRCASVAGADVGRPAGGGGRGARPAGGARARALHASRASRRAPPISAATRWR